MANGAAAQELWGVLGSGLGGVVVTLGVSGIQGRLRERRAQRDHERALATERLETLEAGLRANQEAVAELRGLVSVFVPHPHPHRPGEPE